MDKTKQEIVSDTGAETAQTDIRRSSSRYADKADASRPKSSSRYADKADASRPKSSSRYVDKADASRPKNSRRSAVKTDDPGQRSSRQGLFQSTPLPSFCLMFCSWGDLAITLSAQAEQFGMITALQPENYNAL